MIDIAVAFSVELQCFFTLSFNYGATCDESSGWCYDLSVNQCFYNFEQAQLSIDGQVQSLDSGSFDGNSCPNADCDIIGVFVILDNGQEQCIGWQYQLPDVIGTYQVPAMGYYEVEGDVIYGLENGQIPMFKIWDASEEIAYDAIVLNKEQILDSNDDGLVDDQDLTILILFILVETDSETTWDINFDSVVDIFDLLFLSDCLQEN